MRKRKFHGYTIFEDGTILGLHGRELKRRLNKGRYEVRLIVGDSRKNFTLSRLIYYVFNEFDIDNKDLCVTYKDENKLNIHLDNLELVHRSELVQGEGHSSIAKLSDEDVKTIRKLYRGKVSANQHNKTGHSLNDLAKMYNVSKGNIALIVRGESRNKKNYILKNEKVKYKKQKKEVLK